MKPSFRSAAAAAVLFFLLPLSCAAAELLIPVGTVIGLQLQDDTVTVAAFEETDRCGAKAAGLKIGDEILKIDDFSIRSTEDVRLALSTCGEKIRMTVRRGSKLSTLCLTPEATEEGPRLGLYLRQGIAGIGTVTYYDPETGYFGTLGHGVNDKNGSLLNLKQGYAYEASVGSVTKGTSGSPGQLKGNTGSTRAFASLLRNTPQGVFGIAPRHWQGEAVPVASYEEIQTGPACIRSTVIGSAPQEYSVEILKIYAQDRSDGRNFLLKVTDPDLLATTGGIVQGMSGSPICQNGKIVGAVTHVLVNDPTTGYGIFIENMLEAAS